jgi:translation initiation factor 5B
VHQAEGMGATIDALLVQGQISNGDKIMFCGVNGPVTATIRSIITAKGEQELGKGDLV